MGIHGKPDWGLQLKKTVYTFDDLSELAVRLGSEVFFDRRGDVFLIDSFENGLGKWELGGGGDGNKQLITAERARSGGYSVKLIGGSTDSWLARMYNYFPYPVLSKWGAEVHFSIGPGIDKVYFIIRQETGTHAKLASILYDRENEKLQYQVGEDDYQDIKTSFLLYENTYLFHVFKLVADLENFKYQRLIVNDVEYDLSAYDMYSFGNVVTKHLEVQILLYSRDLNNDYIYVDNIIITQNEP